MVCCLHEPGVVTDYSCGHSGSGCPSCNYQIHGASHCILCLQACNHQEKKSIVCYFTNWAVYRDGRAKFTPENINATLCTHINYAFASLDNNTLTITMYDKESDLNKRFFELVTAFKKKGLTVLISIGGWNDSKGDKWNRLISDAKARTNFVTTAIEFLKKYSFDGLDVDYEFPGCPQENRTAAFPNSKENFNKLLYELKAAFSGKFLLTVATSALKDVIYDCYDMAGVCDAVDWINIMTYDYHSYLQGETGANAPVCSSGRKWGVLDTVKYYRNTLNCPAHKLVMGVPFYAKTYTLVHMYPAKFGVRTSGAGTPGTYTKTAGFLAYYETCLLLKQTDWKSGFNRVNGTYAWKGNQFISVPNQVDVVRKSCIINHYNLKGAMFWTLDYDDFNNICGGGNYPLLKTLNQQVRCVNTP